MTQPTNTSLQTQNTAPAPLASPTNKQSLAARGLNYIMQLGKVSGATAEEMCKKGDDYFFGRNGEKRDDVEAVRWYLKAAKMGHVEMQYILGSWYIYDIVVDKNFVQAARWYRKAANQGHSEAQFKLGFSCEHGWGRSAPYDYKTAISWYLKSIRQGSSGSKYRLAALEEKIKNKP